MCHLPARPVLYDLDTRAACKSLILKKSPIFFSNLFPFFRIFPTFFEKKTTIPIGKYRKRRAIFPKNVRFSRTPCRDFPICQFNFKLIEVRTGSKSLEIENYQKLELIEFDGFYISTCFSLAK